MRDYTYLGGNRFIVVNIFRSQRYDVDRLDINWTDENYPDFVRGFRVVDHQEGETFTLHSEDADKLSYSLAYIYSHSNGDELTLEFDEYLKTSTLTKNYLIKTKIKESQEDTLH